MLLDDIPKPIQIETPRKCVLFGLFDKENEIVGSCDLYSYTRIFINDSKDIRIKHLNKEKVLEFIEFLENEFEIHSHYRLDVWSTIQNVDNSVYLSLFEAYNQFFNLGLDRSDYLKYFPTSFTNIYGGIYYHNKKTNTYNLITKNEFLFVFCDIGKIFIEKNVDVDIDYKNIIMTLQRENEDSFIQIINNISQELVDRNLVSSNFVKIFNDLKKLNIGIKPVKIENKEFLSIFSNGESINKIKKCLNGKIVYESFVGVKGLSEFSIF